MPQYFYIAKARDDDNDLLPPITVYATDIDAAKAAVRSSLKIADDRGLQVVQIKPMHEQFFDRNVDDGRGVVTHGEILWTGEGPIQPISLFGDQQ